MYRLHVYENLVQVPTLVLRPGLTLQPNLHAPDFRLNIDSGPSFHPRHLRLEGEDPIQLAIFLDLHDRAGRAFLSGLGDTDLPSALSPARDRMEIFASGCTFLHGPENTVASPFLLRTLIGNLLLSPSLAQPPPGDPHCRAAHRLWDRLATVLTHLAAGPGRRVLVVFSDGEDSGSQTTWDRLRSYASENSIAIFGIRSGPPAVFSLPARGRLPVSVAPAAEDFFSLVCDGTGGLVLDGSVQGAAKSLQQVLNWLPERYILEFARPGNDTSGRHTLDVSLPDRTLLIRASGITIPLRDPKLATDPTTVPSDPSRAPVQGTRKAMSPLP